MVAVVNGQYYSTFIYDQQGENLMFNFNKTKEQSSDQATDKSTQYENSATEAKQEQGEKKKVHVQDGVCCGGCGGE